MKSIGTKRFLLARKLKFADGIYVVAQSYAKLEDLEFIDQDGQVWKVIVVSLPVWETLCAKGSAVCRQGNKRLVLTLPVKQENK